MRELRNYFYIQKADGSEIVDVSSQVDMNVRLVKGDIGVRNNSYADAPVYELNMTLLNNNDYLFSTCYEKYKVKYDMAATVSGTGSDVYNSPYENTLEVTSDSTEYVPSFLKGQIHFNKSIPIGTTVKLWISYIDTTEINPLNHLADGSYVPLIQEGNTVGWKQTIYDTELIEKSYRGNGTNELQVNFDFVDVSAIVVKVKDGAKYEDLLDVKYEKILEMSYGTLMGKEIRTESAYVTDVAQANLYKDILEMYYVDVLDMNYSDLLRTNSKMIKFNRVIEEDEIIYLQFSVRTLVKEIQKFIGKITGGVTSELDTCTFYCKDLSYDLVTKRVFPTSFRNYFTISTDTELYTLEEKLSNINCASNQFTVNYNNIDFIFVGQKLYFYDGQNFTEATVQAKVGNTVTLNTLENGSYSVWIRYEQGILLEPFIQKCLDDLNTGYNLLVKDQSNFAIIPKIASMQNTDLWNFLQSIVAQRGYCLSFVYTSPSESYYDAYGNVVSGTDGFELVCKDLNVGTGTPKFIVSEKNIENSANLETSGLSIVSSYSIKYFSAETNEIEQTIYDDFLKSTYQAIIPNEKNIIITDELLAINEAVRVGKEYRYVKRAIDSQTYEVNLPFADSGTFDLYLQGETTDKYGLKRAYIEEDSTSDIDTVAESEYFGALLLNQNKDIYAEYEFTLLSKDFYDLNNFDTITINSPRFNLINKDMIIQSISETYNKVTFTVSEILNIGKFKYYNMRVEKGNNNIFTADKIGTNDIFPPVTSLVAQEPAIDNQAGYQVYTVVSWDKLVGRNVVSYEIQYKKQGEDWANAEVVTLKENSLKMPLKEQSIYNIRVRGTGKEQVKGEWAETNIDSSKSFVVNPVENRTWYVRLFDGNSYDEYGFAMQKAGYTAGSLFDLIDNIIIIPSEVYALNPSILWSLKTSPTSVTDGLEFWIDYFMGFSNHKKNIHFMPCPAGGEWKLYGYGNLDLEKYENVTGEGTKTIFNKEVPGGYASGAIRNYNETSGKLRKISGIKFRYDATNATVLRIIESDFSISLQESRTIFEDIVTEVHGNTASLISSVNFFSTNRLYSCTAIGGIEGFASCKEVVGCVSRDNNIGFNSCNAMSKNSTTNNAVSKYSSCFASVSNDPVYAIASGGSDTANGGFNT